MLPLGSTPPRAGRLQIGGPLLLLLLAVGCAGNIQALYQAEKDKVLADAGPAGDDWTPDLRLRLSNASLQEMATAAVDAGLLRFDKTLKIDGPLGIQLSVTPSAQAKALEVRPGKGCPACLSLSADLAGKADWKAGPLDGSIPFTATLGADLDFEAEKGAQAWMLSAHLRRVQRLSVSSPAIRTVEVGPLIKGWIQDALAKAPPVQLGEVGGGQLPLRALRLDTHNGLVEVEALSDVAGGGRLAPVDRPLREGWELLISQDTVAAMLRRQAFQAGTLSHDVALDPQDLRFDGQDFGLNLRLWRLKGAGWWRDYSVTGSGRVQQGKLRLRSEDAQEAGKSRGAELADPIAFLAEGRILDEVAGGIRQAMPSQVSRTVQGLRLVVTADQLSGEGDAVVVRGSAEVK